MNNKGHGDYSSAIMAFLLFTLFTASVIWSVAYLISSYFIENKWLRRLFACTVLAIIVVVVVTMVN